jgi:hypothetical protein
LFDSHPFMLGSEFNSDPNSDPNLDPKLRHHLERDDGFGIARVNRATPAKRRRPKSRANSSDFGQQLWPSCRAYPLPLWR